MDRENFGSATSLGRASSPRNLRQLTCNWRPMMPVSLLATFADPAAVRARRNRPSIGVRSSLGRASPDDETNRFGRFTSLCARKNACRRHNQSVAEASHVSLSHGRTSVFGFASDLFPVRARA